MKNKITSLYFLFILLTGAGATFAIQQIHNNNLPLFVQAPEPDSTEKPGLEPDQASSPEESPGEPTLEEKEPTLQELLEEADRHRKARQESAAADDTFGGLDIIGHGNLSFSFGSSHYLSEKDRLDSTKEASSPFVSQGFVPEVDIKVNMKGGVDDRVEMAVDYDQAETFSNNDIQVTYSGKEDEALQKVTFGNLDVSFGKSELLLYDTDKFNAIGLSGEFDFDAVTLSGYALMSQTLQHTEVFQGGQVKARRRIPEYNYTARKIYQLEPFLYYDGFTSPPASLGADVYTPGAAGALQLFTSDDPDFKHTPVEINPRSVKIYIDDLIATNDNTLGATPKIVGGNDLGNYHLMRYGIDYTFHAQTGRISFKNPLPPEAKVYVSYQRTGGRPTSDPCVRTVNGKHETFLRYGRNMHEDDLRDGVASFNGSDDMEIIPDSKVNLDIYEVRGSYELGAGLINPETFKVALSTPAGESADSIEQMGRLKTWYKTGVLSFENREPFRTLAHNNTNTPLDSVFLGALYNETQPLHLKESSRFFIDLDFEADLTSYQLKYFNIVENSELVKVNGVEIPRELYRIDYQSGYFQFLSPTHPYIGPNGKIEITYDYLPFNTDEQSYMAGLRAETGFLDPVTVGTSVVYQGEIAGDSAPLIGEEPDSNVLLQGDILIDLKEKEMTGLINALSDSKYSNVPIKLQGRAEYAQSFYLANTYGLAIIDSLESAEENIEVELLAKEWGLSAPPSGTTFSECNRAPLFYKHYYDPARPDLGLQTVDYPGYYSAPYATTAGPYNIGTGHIQSEYIETDYGKKPTSLILDFDFLQAPDTTRPFVAINTRNLFKGGADLSEISYLEFNARLNNYRSLSAGVEIYFDLGVLKEDSDSDGIFDTEDTGLNLRIDDTNGNNIQDAGEKWDAGEKNGVVDSEKSSGISEDRGYPFNPPCAGGQSRTGGGPDMAGYPSTKGNGRLDTEDINGNGKLDNVENIIRIDPSQLYTDYNGSNNQILPGGWKTYRIYFKKDQMSPVQKRLFQSIQNARIYLVPSSGSGSGAGRLWIDQLRFGGTLWKTAKAKKLADTFEIDAESLNIHRVSSIDTINNTAEYYNRSFLQTHRAEYEKLYGKVPPISLSAIRESTLKLEYDLSALYQYLYIRRSFTRRLDLKYYKHLNIWVNHINPPGSQALFIVRVSSGENDYLEFETPTGPPGWRHQIYDLTLPVRRMGNTDLGNIRSISAGIRRPDGNTQTLTGTSWINNIYVSGPALRSDRAYLYELTAEFTRPLFKTSAGIPLLADTTLHYKKKEKGFDYQPIHSDGETWREIREEFHAASALTPSWKASYDYLSIKQNREGSSHSFEPRNHQTTQHTTRHRFFENEPNAPHILLAYDNINKKNTYLHPVYGQQQQEEVFIYSEQSDTPALYIQGVFPEFAQTKLNYEIESSIEFTTIEKESRIKSQNSVISSNLRRQKQQIDRARVKLGIHSHGVHITPSHGFSRGGVVQKNWSDFENSATIAGDFYNPFEELPETYRYRFRHADYSLHFMIERLWIFMPVVNFEIKYREDNFKDNASAQTGPYERLRDPASAFVMQLNLPLFFEEIGKNFSLLQNFSLSFYREINLDEKSLPFIPRSSLYKDPLGLSRISTTMAKYAFDLANYPMWHFFLGAPGAPYLNGRRALFEENFIPGEDPAAGSSTYHLYDNEFSITESMTFSGEVHLKSWTLLLQWQLAQELYRRNIFGLPMQTLNHGASAYQNFDLSKLLEPEPQNQKTDSVNLGLNFHWRDVMFVTQNMIESTLRPEIILSLSWKNNLKFFEGLSFLFAVEFFNYHQKAFITPGVNELDTLLYDNIRNHRLIQELKRTNYSGAIEYSSEWPGLKSSLEKMLKRPLNHNPKYTIKFSGDLGKSEFNIENLFIHSLLDSWTIEGILNANLHKNITGILDAKLVYDIHKNPLTHNVQQEILSFEFGISLQALF